MIFYGTILRDNSVLVNYNFKNINIKEYSLINFINKEKANILERPKIFNSSISNNSNIICNKINNIKNDFYILFVVEVNEFDIIENNLEKLFLNLSNELENNYKNILLMGNVDIYYSKLLKKLIDNYNTNYTKEKQLIFIEKEVNNIEESVSENFNKLIKRGEDLSSLNAKAENIQRTTFDVYHNSKRLKNKFLYERYKNLIIIVIIFIIFFIYLKFK